MSSSIIPFQSTIRIRKTWRCCTRSATQCSNTRPMSASVSMVMEFVVDVKSTGLFITDPVLQQQNAKTTYWKTGHSYMKRRTHELKALAGFEKSGHYFFNAPFGRGYDDGLVSALAICDMMDRNPRKKMSELKDALPKTWARRPWRRIATTRRNTASSRRS